MELMPVMIGTFCTFFSGLFWVLLGFVHYLSITLTSKWYLHFQLVAERYDRSLSKIVISYSIMKISMHPRLCIFQFKFVLIWFFYSIVWNAAFLYRTSMFARKLDVFSFRISVRPSQGIGSQLLLPRIIKPASQRVHDIGHQICLHFRGTSKDARTLPAKKKPKVELPKSRVCYDNY
jgi:hypothetical protein